MKNSIIVHVKTPDIPSIQAAKARVELINHVFGGAEYCGIVYRDHVRYTEFKLHGRTAQDFAEQFAEYATQ